MKRSIEPIRGGRVLLRLLEERDLPTTLAWRNQDHVRRWFFDPEPILPAQHRAWFERYRERDDDFVFVIEETERLRRPVGQVALYDVDWTRRRAEYGRLLIGDGEAAGRGLAREATALVVDAGFGVFGLREIHLEVLADNRPARAIYEKCGFLVEGEKDGRVRMSRRRPDADPDMGAIEPA